MSAALIFKQCFSLLNKISRIHHKDIEVQLDFGELSSCCEDKNDVFPLCDCAQDVDAVIYVLGTAFEAIIANLTISVCIVYPKVKIFQMCYT